MQVSKASLDLEWFKLMLFTPSWKAQILPEQMHHLALQPWPQESCKQLDFHRWSSGLLCRRGTFPPFIPPALAHPGGDVADGYSYINRLPPIQRAAPPPAAVAQPETFFCRLGWSSGGTAFSTSTSSSAEARSRWSTASSATFCKHPSETTFISPMGRGGASQAVS